MRDLGWKEGRRCAASARLSPAALRLASSPLFSLGAFVASPSKSGSPGSCQFYGLCHSLPVNSFMF